MNIPITLDYSNPALLTQRSKSIKPVRTNKIRRIDILFDNDNGPQPGLYTSGSNMSGKIYMDIVKPVKVVRVRLKVESVVRVSDTKTSVLDHNLVLYGTEQGRKTADRLSPRIYQFPFSIELPSDLPTTICRNSLLRAAYKVTACIIRVSPTDDIVVERPFIVHNISDQVLTDYADGQSPSCQDFSFKSTPVQGTITLPRTGFFLGDKLKALANISNNDSSSKKIKIGVKVSRTVLGRGKCSYGLFKVEDNQTFTTVITDRMSEYTKISKQGSEVFEVEIPLTIMEPTSKQKLIDIDYSCHVAVFKEGVFGDSKPKLITFPITIAPPTSIALYPTSYTELSYQGGDTDSILAGPSAPSLYPDLSGGGAQATAPELDSDDENPGIHGDLYLPSYDEAMALGPTAPAHSGKS